MPDVGALNLPNPITFVRRQWRGVRRIPPNRCQNLSQPSLQEIIADRTVHEIVESRKVGCVGRGSHQQTSVLQDRSPTPTLCASKNLEPCTQDIVWIAPLKTEQGCVGRLRDRPPQPRGNAELRQDVNDYLMNGLIQPSGIPRVKDQSPAPHKSTSTHGDGRSRSS